MGLPLLTLASKQLQTGWFLLLQPLLLSLTNSSRTPHSSLVSPVMAVWEWWINRCRSLDSGYLHVLLLRFLEGGLVSWLNCEIFQFESSWSSWTLPFKSNLSFKLCPTSSWEVISRIVNFWPNFVLKDLRSGLYWSHRSFLSISIHWGQWENICSEWTFPVRL